MNREHIMAVLYDMAMVIGGETSLRPLLTKTLQRLLYHTSFPVGLLFLGQVAAGEGTVDARLELAIGDWELCALAGRTVTLPAALLREGAEMREDAPLLAGLPCPATEYHVFLRLPVDRQGVILLLAPRVPHAEVPLVHVFQPVMANLAKAMVLCRSHDAQTAGLEAERDAARLGLERFRAAVDTSADSVSLIDPAALRFVDFNRRTEKTLGYTRAELLATDPMALTPFLSREEFARRCAELLRRRHDEHTIETLYRRRDGSEFPVEIRLSAFAPAGEAPLVIAAARDITLRKRGEEALRESEERFRLITAWAHDAIVIVDDAERIAYWNEAAHRLFGYTAEQALGKDMRHLLAPASQHVADEVVFTSLVRAGRGSVAGRTMETVGIRSDGTEFPVELSVSAVRLQERWHAIGILRDVTERRRTEETLRRSEAILKESNERLRRSLEDTIRAVAATVEMRDPYTAGHQARVARLAEAIAREMGLAEDRIYGLRLAASVHDLGKNAIPAEILSKPGRLTPLEREIIKTHAQAGHDILREIQFPWPLATIVLQHHEHIDGSGYPAGLRGDEVLLEARILCVADLVEAISSHRPYRPTLGIEAALQEISEHRGTRYDPAVVDACIRLIREGRFIFPG